MRKHHHSLSRVSVAPLNDQEQTCTPPVQYCGEDSMCTCVVCGYNNNDVVIK